jgi:hypothetical protein
MNTLILRKSLPLCLLALVLPATSIAQQAASGPTTRTEQVTDAFTSAQSTYTWGGQTLAPVRFLGFAQIDDERKKQLREDAAILAHLLTNQENMPLQTVQNSLGVYYASPFGQNYVAYVEGSGLHFVFSTATPVAPDAETGDDESETSESESEGAWEKARRAIQNQQSGGQAALTFTGVRTGGVGGANPIHGTVQHSLQLAKFKSEEFSEIDNAVRGALAQAGNVRGLSDGDVITVQIIGPGNQDERSVAAWRVRPDGASDGGEIPADQIEMVQYREPAESGGGYSYNFTMPSVSPYTPPGQGSAR